MGTEAIVLGLGQSGLAAASLLRREGHAVTGLDSAPSVDARRRLDEMGAHCMVCDDLPLLGTDSLVVVSPGIPATHRWVVAARSRGLPVISELELGFRHSCLPVMAVTGSNGKSSVAKLCAEALSLAGGTVALGANYGTPYCDLIQQCPNADWMVLEVSSFQMEWVDTFRPRIGILLNIHPNHLDRHGDMETYAAAKLRFFRRMGEGDTAVIPYDWVERVRGGGADALCCRTFGAQGTDFAYASGWVTPLHGAPISISGSMFDNPVLGPHAAAAAAGLLAAGLDAQSVSRAVCAATPLPHRMSPVGTWGGVSYINDSKATNLASMCAALRMADGPVRLIAGGRLKEKNLQNPKELLANKARRVYLIGEASASMYSAWHSSVECVECGTLDHAVQRARTDSAAGDVVLLSPGCASFDQFPGFAQRGDRFEELVAAIGEGEQG